jgi:hypothetical protein
VYRNDNGTGGQTTTFTYTWQGTTTQAASVTTTMPTVTTAQNGPNTAATTQTVFDEFGRTIWTMDADGFISHVGYDAATGAAVKSITDVTYASLTSDEQASFDATGWSQPANGLHLITSMLVVAVFPSEVAVIVAVPRSSAVTTPVLASTDATAGAELLHVTGRPVRTVFPASRSVAVSGTVTVRSMGWATLPPMVMLLAKALLEGPAGSPQPAITTAARIATG